MNKIKYKSKTDLQIKFEKINPFFNICKVNGTREECNITVEYIPNNYVLEIESFRKYFKQDFNMYIEELAETTFNKIWKLIKPKYLKVTSYLDEKKLTPWSVTIEKWHK